MPRWLPILILAVALLGCGDDENAPEGATGATGAEGAEFGVTAEGEVREDMARRVNLIGPTEETASDGTPVLRSSGHPAAQGDTIEASCEGASCEATLTTRDGSFVYVIGSYRLTGTPDDPAPELEGFECPYESSYCGYLESSG